MTVSAEYSCGCKCHPSVAVAGLPDPDRRKPKGSYAVVLTGRDGAAGRPRPAGCDFCDGTMRFLPPESGELPQGEGAVLTFDGDFAAHTPLARRLGDYTFFRYLPGEALHLSRKEKAVAERCLADIAGELQWGVDELTETIVAERIVLLLDYCLRFYLRQFIMRRDLSSILLRKAEKITDDFILAQREKATGEATAAHCAGRLGLSAAYFADMLRIEKGMTPDEYCRQRRLLIAKELLVNTPKTVELITRELGFPSPQYFSFLFKCLTGSDPHDYRARHLFERQIITG